MMDVVMVSLSIAALLLLGFSLLFRWASRLEFYERHRTGPYVEDQAGFVFLGRHTYKLILTGKRRYWTMTTDRMTVKRGFPHWPIDMRSFIRWSGWRGRLALVEDFLGLSFVSRWMNRRQQPPDVPFRPMMFTSWSGAETNGPAGKD